MESVVFDECSNIECIEYLDEQEEMYDLEIEEVECYYAEGYLTHNCSQELFLAANFSHDSVMYPAIRDKEDLHKQMAIRMFGEENYDSDKRKKAKIGSFGLLYGGSPWTLMKANPGMTQEEAEHLYKTYWAAARDLKKHINYQVSKCYANGGNVYTAYGRPRRMKKHLTSSNYKMRAYGERAIFNHQVQGTGGDICRIVLVKLDKFIRSYPEHTLYFNNTTHDSINVEIKDEYTYDLIPKIKDLMEIQPPKCDFPLRVSFECGKHYGCLFPFMINKDNNITPKEG